jgi:hypothetical protein
MRNANLGILVFAVLATAGCWLAGWEVDDTEAFWIVTISFSAGLGALTMLEIRFPTKRPDGDSAERRR